MKEGYTVPWELLAHLMRSLNEVDMSAWKEYEFSEEDSRLFRKVFNSEQAALDFTIRSEKYRCKLQLIRPQTFPSSPV